MLKLIVSDDFVDIVSNMPIMCVNKIFQSIVAIDSVSQNEADRIEKVSFKELYDRIKNQK